MSPEIVNIEYVCKYDQGYKGIRQWSKKLLYIPDDDTQISPFCRIQLVVETFGQSTQWTNQTNFKKVPQGCYAKE